LFQQNQNHRQIYAQKSSFFWDASKLNFIYSLLVVKRSIVTILGALVCGRFFAMILQSVQDVLIRHTP
jgi:capsule polysaccharide modification protein KpsS